ncbi:MAG: EI24 domain-containing protein [Thermodesulfobacteriota bacterium]
MGLVQGLLYNLKGLRLGFSSGRLLLWGLLRFVLLILIMLALSWLVIIDQDRITNLLWSKPASPWISWLWHLLSWFITLLLIAFSAVFSYLLSQVLFSVLIMEHMSRLTELKVTGCIAVDSAMPLRKSFLYLIGQEIPRTLVPVLISLLIMVLGWVTPFGPILALISSAVAIIFLSWDNTDLVPARKKLPFAARFRALLRTLPFHLGFGLPFLVPVVNILFLCFAPVGATLYHLERK